MTDVTLEWDDLLDDYEDRIDSIWAMSESDGAEGDLEIEPFAAPEGTATRPEQHHIERFRSLERDAAAAAAALTERRNDATADFAAMQRSLAGRRHYVTSDRRR